MAKIILNGCFGGYRWSIKGVYAVLRQKDIPVKFMATVYPKPGEPEKIELSKSDFFEIQKSLDDGNHRCGPHGWYVSNLFFVDNKGTEYDEHDIRREDPVAIAVLESLGSEFCSAECANLYIEEYDEKDFIPSIDEYDGSETLELTPRVTEERIRACRSIDEVAEFLRRLKVIVQE